MLDNEVWIVMIYQHQVRLGETCNKVVKKKKVYVRRYIPQPVDQHLIGLGSVLSQSSASLGIEKKGLVIMNHLHACQVGHGVLNG